jgi:uncharacterized lipoprotein YbaY
MKSLLITATVAAAALLLPGCQHKQPEPVPGPQSAAMQEAWLLQSPPVGPVAQRLVQGTHRCGAFARKRAKWTG